MCEQHSLPELCVPKCHALLRGAGKTHIGLRLAQLYGLLHINTAIILAELQHMDAETQKVWHPAGMHLWGMCDLVDSLLQPMVP
jgi:hypothetical protein